MDRFLVALLIIVLVFAAVTSGLHLVFRRRPVVKYLPSFLVLTVSIYHIGLARASGGGFEALARGLMASLGLFGALSGVAAGLLWDLVVPRMNKRGDNTEG